VTHDPAPLPASEFLGVLAGPRPLGEPPALDGQIGEGGALRKLRSAEDFQAFASPADSSGFRAAAYRHGTPVNDEKPIGSVTTNILPSRGELPANFAGPRFSQFGEEFHTVGTSRPWGAHLYDWEATALCYGPLYFEQPNAERLGHSASYFQPIVSGAHFFAHIPVIPYMVAATPPWQCISPLGHYRPGSDAPLRYIRLPLSVAGGLAQAGTVVGLVYLIP